MLVIERFYNPVLLVSLSPNQPAVEKRLRLAWRKKPNFCSRCSNVFFLARKQLVASRNVGKVFSNLAATGFGKFCDQLKRHFQ